MRLTCSVDLELRSICAALEGHMDPDGAARARDDLTARIGPQAPSLVLDLRAVDWMSRAEKVEDRRRRKVLRSDCR